MSTWSRPQVGQENITETQDVCQLPNEEGGNAAVLDDVAVDVVEVTGSQEGGDEIVHIIASGELIRSKVTGFLQFEVRAAIVLITRGEGGDEIVHIIASSKLIGSKVTGFPRIEVRAAIVVMARGEEALEQSLLVRAEGGRRIRPRLSTNRKNSARVVMAEEGAN